MKLPASAKKSMYGNKPHIKKGYYPAKLLKVEGYKDKDGNLKEGKFGRQLIFEFAVYNADAKTGVPTTQMDYSPDKANKEVKADVDISKFVYHEYKDQKSGEYKTAVTPNSAITKLLTSLGWTFSPEGVDIDPLIGNWVELNIDDYEFDSNDGKKVASTIKDINPYKGPEVKEDADKASPKQPETILSVEDKDKTKEEILAKIGELKKLNKEGLLSDKGLKMGIESLETSYQELK